jgi:hypothetical protein
MVAMRSLALATLLAAAVTSARADVVPPPPKDCPAGYTAMTSHQGPYCRPPLPQNCPAGHTPRVEGTKAYCEPPPPKPCPPGAYWVSNGPGVGNGYCTSRLCGECSDEMVCIDSSLCVRERTGIRGRRYEVISGPCRTAGDCPSGEACTKARRCVTPNQLKASGSRAPNKPGKTPAGTTRGPEPSEATSAPSPRGPKPGTRPNPSPEK